MNIVGRLRAIAGASILVVFGTWDVSAQTVDAAHGPLFQADPRSGAHKLVNFTLSTTEGRDDDLGADSAAGTSPLQSHVAGRYEDVDGALTLIGSGRRFSIGARATGTARRTPGVAGLAASNANAALDLTAAMTNKTTLRANLSASRVTTFSFDTFLQRSQADETSVSSKGAADVALDWARTSYGGTLTLSRTIGRVSSFSLIGAAGHDDRPVLDQHNDDVSASAVFTRNVGRDQIIRAAYTAHAGFQLFGGDTSSLWSHDLQMSADKTWRHSKFRRTVVSVSGGTSFLQQRLTTHTFISPVVPGSDEYIAPIDVRGEARQQNMRAIGGVALSHDLTSDWNVQTWYRRGPAVREAIFFANTVGLDFRGTFKRRLALGLSGGYSDDGAGPGTSLNRYRTAFGSTRIQVALARYVAIQAQYFLYHYMSAASPDAPGSLARQVNRRGVRLSIVLWAPVIRGAA
jgi:hypothetical protein